MLTTLWPWLMASFLGLLACPSTAGDLQQPAQKQDLAAQLEALRVEAGLPALGAACVTRAGCQQVLVSGLRRAGGHEAATTADLWHLGSCTKSMTATLLALLVARGDLSWETTLEDLLPELRADMHEQYRELSLLELLSHRAGIADEAADFLQFERAAGLEVRVLQRRTLAKAALARAPKHPPRTQFLYSNLGYVIAGHIAEVATQRSWEELIEELLFRPLGMESASFGAPGVAESESQPRGHTPDGKPLDPGPWADNPLALGPAGTVHATLADWAKYIQLHLRGVKEDVLLGELKLTREAFALLHRAYAAEGQRYALGWVVESRPWAGGDGHTLWHNGSNTYWYCVTWLGLEKGLATLVVTNQATPAASAIADRASALMLQSLAQ